MTGKHLFNSSDTLVLESLRGGLRANPALSLLERDKVVVYLPKAIRKVTLLSGGGSGHEPAHAGYVGKGMLNAAVSGTIFASPSTKQIMAGLRTIRSDAGSLVIVKNYTGDVLHFGLSAERAKTEGIKVEVVVVGDDVAVGREKGKLVGRRGLAGTVLVHKIAGALAESQKVDLHSLAQVAHSVVASMVTVGASLDHCSVPDRSAEEFLHQQEMEVGMGIHNEPGVLKLSPVPKSSELVERLLKILLDQSDNDRAYVKFDFADDVVVLVNNLGGISNLELSAFAECVVLQLETEYGISPRRLYVGPFMTALNGPGVSITLLNVSRIESPVPILELLDAPTEAVGWSGNVSSSTWNQHNKLNIIEPPEGLNSASISRDLATSAEAFQRGLERAAQALKDAEPQITQYDTIAGDGDCGETLVNGANGILSAIKNRSLNLSLAVVALSQISEIVEDTMGGTSGALYSIFLSALAQGVQHEAAKQQRQELKLPIFARAAQFALEGLSKYTSARPGDRTLIDALAPFVAEISRTSDLSKAVEAARAGADSTKDMNARLGRASYVDSSKGLPPDPGMLSHQY